MLSTLGIIDSSFNRRKALKRLFAKRIFLGMSVVHTNIFLRGCSRSKNIRVIPGIFAIALKEVEMPGSSQLLTTERLTYFHSVLLDVY